MALRQAHRRVPDTHELHAELDQLFRSDARRWAELLVEADTARGVSALDYIPSAAGRQRPDLGHGPVSDEEVRQIVTGQLDRLAEHLGAALSEQDDDRVRALLDPISAELRWLMLSWWHRDVIAAGKLPLMLCFVSFVLTFVSTRAITRLIRDGRGPFRNVTAAWDAYSPLRARHHPADDRRVHGGRRARHDGLVSFSAIAVGIGIAPVLDEFALILHLQMSTGAARASSQSKR